MKTNQEGNHPINKLGNKLRQTTHPLALPVEPRKEDVGRPTPIWLHPKKNHPFLPNRHEDNTFPAREKKGAPLKKAAIQSLPGSH